AGHPHGTTQLPVYDPNNRFGTFSRRNISGVSGTGQDNMIDWASAYNNPYTAATNTNLPSLNKGLGYDYNTGVGSDYGLYTGSDVGNWASGMYDQSNLLNTQNQSVDDEYRQYVFDNYSKDLKHKNPNTLSQYEWYKAGKPSGSSDFEVTEELVDEKKDKKNKKTSKGDKKTSSSINDYASDADISEQVDKGTDSKRGNVQLEDSEKVKGAARGFVDGNTTTQGSGSQTPYNVLYPKQGLFNRNKAPLYWNADDTYLKSVDEKYRKPFLRPGKQGALKRRKLEFDHYLPGQGPFPTQEEKENPFIKTEDTESTESIESTEGTSKGGCFPGSTDPNCKQQDIDANDPAGTNTNQGNPEGTGPGAMKGSADVDTEGTEGTENVENQPTIEGINEASLEELYAARDGVEGGGAGAIDLGAEGVTAQIQARIDELEAESSSPDKYAPNTFNTEGDFNVYNSFEEYQKEYPNSTQEEYQEQRELAIRQAYPKNVQEQLLTEDPNNPGQMIEGTFEDIYDEANAPVVGPTGYQNIPSEGGPYAESTVDLERQKQIFDNMQSQLTRPEGSTDIRAQYERTGAKPSYDDWAAYVNAAGTGMPTTQAQYDAFFQKHGGSHDIGGDFSGDEEYFGITDASPDISHPTVANVDNRGKKQNIFEILPYVERGVAPIAYPYRKIYNNLFDPNYDPAIWHLGEKSEGDNSSIEQYGGVPPEYFLGGILALPALL
ncbi:MAG: hypothetical protein ACTSQA_08350, partial [Candidatus Heimdallarchaeaceae archaeon]